MYTKNVQVEEGVNLSPCGGYGINKRSLLAHFLVTIYGIGACVGVNGIIAEVPLLVTFLPEGPALPAYLTVVCSTAYLAPAVYALSVKFAPRLIIRNNFPWISGVLILGTTAMVLLAFFHDLRTIINGTEHSIAMQILFFAAASCTGTRDVLLLPYLRQFGGTYLTSFYIGEGLSGFFPSTLALIQGVGGNSICSNNANNSTRAGHPPKFPPRDFFLLIAAVLILSTLAFWSLEYLRGRTSRRFENAKFRYDRRVSTGKHISARKLMDHSLASETHGLGTTEVKPSKRTHLFSRTSNRVSDRDRIYLYVMIWLVCFVAHGYLNSAEAYSARPYGNSAHNLVVNLSQLAGTTAYTLGYWMPPLGIRGVTGLLIPAAVGSAYVTWLALSSPTPLWHDTSYGVVHLIIVWVVLMALVAYAKLSIVAIFYLEPEGEGLYVAGFLSLLGTMCGAAFSFSIINYTALFTPYTVCELHECHKIANRLYNYSSSIYI